MSSEANARLRDRRANDAEYRDRLNANRQRYRQRVKAGLITEQSKPDDPTERWLQLWLAFNRCEGIREEERVGKESAAVWDDHWEATKKATHEPARSEFGLADDYENDE
jgi:hypothetical protein